VLRPTFPEGKRAGRIPFDHRALRAEESQLAVLIDVHGRRAAVTALLGMLILPGNRYVSEAWAMPAPRTDKEMIAAGLLAQLAAQRQRGQAARAPQGRDGRDAAG
jgi:hypothetical protein